MTSLPLTPPSSPEIPIGDSENIEDSPKEEKSAETLVDEHFRNCGVEYYNIPVSKTQNTSVATSGVQSSLLTNLLSNTPRPKDFPPDKLLTGLPGLHESLDDHLKSNVSRLYFSSHLFFKFDCLLDMVLFGA